MRAFPQMQTQAIRMYNVKLLRNFHSECPAPAPWSSLRRWVIPAAPTTLAQEKTREMRALLCFRVTINVQIKWEKCLFTEIPIGGLWPGKGWGRPWGQGLWPWHSGDTAQAAWPSSQPVSINCNNNGHWTQAARGRDRQQIQLMYNLALQNTTPAITQTGSVSSACSLRCAHFRVCQYSLAADNSGDLSWGAGLASGCTDCTVSQPELQGRAR